MKGTCAPTTQTTPQTPVRKQDTTPNKVEASRNPIKNKLPREDIHFRWGPRLLNLRNRLQDISLRGPHSWQTF